MLDQLLFRELAENGVKHNPQAIVAIGRAPNGQIIFLEKGTDRAGLTHIINAHKGQFSDNGITVERIPHAVITAATQGKAVATQGKDRIVYEVEIEKTVSYIAVTVADNGYVVGANPTRISKKEL